MRNKLDKLDKLGSPKKPPNDPMKNPKQIVAPAASAPEVPAPAPPSPGAAAPTELAEALLEQRGCSWWQWRHYLLVGS